MLLGTQQYFEHLLNLINNCEQLLESYTLIRDELSDIIESLTFSKLRIIHPSIVKPQTLLDELIEISRHLDHNNLPFQPTLENLPLLISLITLQAFQTETRLIFILNIPLVERETFNLYHLYSVPTKDPKTNLFHTIIPESKFIALSSDNRKYLRIQNLDQCYMINDKPSLCKDIIPLEIQNAPCEVELITTLTPSKKCTPMIMNFEDYNIQPLGKNRWILILPHQLPITYTCPNSPSKTELLNGNKIISLQPRCNAYIGTNQIFAQEGKTSNHSEEHFIPQIPFDCCEDTMKDVNPIKLKKLKINNLNLDELNTAEHKLNQFREELENMGKENFATKHLSTFTIVTIVLISLLISCYLCCRCNCCRYLFGYFKGSPHDPRDGSDHGGHCPQIFNYCNIRSSLSRRASIHSNIQLDEEPNVIYFEDIPGTSRTKTTTPDRRRRKI